MTLPPRSFKRGTKREWRNIFSLGNNLPTFFFLSQTYIHKEIHPYTCHMYSYLFIHYTCITVLYYYIHSALKEEKIVRKSSIVVCPRSLQVLSPWRPPRRNRLSVVIGIRTQPLLSQQRRLPAASLWDWPWKE